MLYRDVNVGAALHYTENQLKVFFCYWHLSFTTVISSITHFESARLIVIKLYIYLDFPMS